MSDSENHEANDPNEISQIHIPACDDQLKPFVGRSFDNFDDAIMFCRKYVEICGFDIRMGSKRKCQRDGTITRQYIYYNREGFKNATPDDFDTCNTKVKRHRVSFRVGCNAQVILKFDSVKGCVVHRFEEGHTHQLISPEFRRYMKVNRNLRTVEKNFMMNYARVNIGPSKAYRFYKEMTGDYSGVGSIVVDWKNHARDRKAFVHGCDAQLTLKKISSKKESSPAFFFDYTIDEHDRLTCLFWADPIARRNCSVFGDVVSFDCTYGTNKYRMIFAPFTGKDNHGKIVTFAAALLCGEDTKTYSWVFEKYKKCMGRSPMFLITDQEPAMKIAVEAVFPQTTHRLCMWHIMTKVPEKIPTHLRKDDDFRKRLNSIVWSDMLGPSDFEKQWNDLMSEFDLLGDKWFAGIFEIRQYWIPAYFRDIPLSGVCRTTSISESVNSFFDKFFSQGSNLSEFLMHYESALDAQRQSNDRLNSLDSMTDPPLKTRLQIEKHAALIYTKNQFTKVQEEIESGCFSCKVKDTVHLDGITTYTIDDGWSGLVKVTREDVSGDVECCCNKFIRDGMLCSHIFWVYNLLDVNVIPEKYIVKRWTKAAYSNPLSDSGSSMLGNCVLYDEKKTKVNKVISDIFACIGSVEGDDVKLQTLVDNVSSLRDALVFGNADSDSTNVNSKLFEIFYGTEKPVEVEVHDPPPVKTKGSGSRIKSRLEAAIKRASKPKRMCKKYKKLSHHDSRNCTLQP